MRTLNRARWIGMLARAGNSGAGGRPTGCLVVHWWGFGLTAAGSVRTSGSFGEVDCGAEAA